MAILSPPGLVKVLLVRSAVLLKSHLDLLAITQGAAEINVAISLHSA